MIDSIAARAVPDNFRNKKKLPFVTNSRTVLAGFMITVICATVVFLASFMLFLGQKTVTQETVIQLDSTLKGSPVSGAAQGT